MKSIKPGRGPSKMSAVGSAFAAAGGVFWCIVAASIGCYIMIPFGVLFIGFVLYNLGYNYHNATSEDRYSVVDIVDEDEEPDPLNEKYSRAKDIEELNKDDASGTKASFCPYCGEPVNGTFDFCPKCGKKLPD